MIVTIDGPAGAGKSTAARALADRLGFDFLDTGAMYRAVALAARQARIDLDNQAQLEILLTELRLEMPGGRVMLNGVDVSDPIRTPEITALSRAVADSPAIRQHLSRLQRQIAQGRDLVTEGRDQGTIVFPDAGCKFFLTADPTERARRRSKELQAQGQAITLEAVLQAQTERDERDAARAIAPMVPAHDAIRLDSTALSWEEVVAAMEKIVRSRMQSMLSERWLRRCYDLLYLPAVWLAILLFSTRTRGRFNVPQTGPFLVVANHQSAIDPLLIALAVNRPMRFLTRRTLFRPRWFGWLLSSLGSIPINHDMSGKDGLKTGLELLRTGNGLLIFPEGTRTRDGRIQALKPGVILLIRRSKAPLIPVAVAGAYQAMPSKSWFPRLCPLCLPATDSALSCVVGEPLDGEALGKMDNEELLAFLQGKLVEVQAEAEELRRHSS